MITIQVRWITALAVIAAVLFAGAAPAGAATPQYHLIANRVIAGQGTADCADISWAGKVGLLDPVEPAWLLALNPADCPAGNRQWLTLYALAGRHQLTCADIRWSAAYGHLPWEHVDELLSFVPGCALDQYERLVALQQAHLFDAVHISPYVIPGSPPSEIPGLLSCTDINWHADQHLITAAQAGWLRDVEVARGVSCTPPTPPPFGAILPFPRQEPTQIVGYRVANQASCWNEPLGVGGYSDDTSLNICVALCITYSPIRPSLGCELHRRIWQTYVLPGH